MHADLNTRITVDAPESHPVYSAFMGSTERRSTGAAEAQAPSASRLIAREVVSTLGPCERIRQYLGVSRTGSAECLAAARAVTTSTAPKWAIDLIADSTAKAPAGQSHDDSPISILGLRARPRPACIDAASGSMMGHRATVRHSSRTRPCACLLRATQAVLCRVGGSRQRNTSLSTLVASVH
jgi:hypothetical protein